MQNPKVLVACEESQRVCTAFRDRGIEAYSCDIQGPSGGHPEWHICGDVIPVLGGGTVTTMDGREHNIGKWDLIIAHPPCTKTSNAGAKHLFRGHKLNLQRYFDGMCGKAFFMTIWNAPCERMAVENPTPSAIFEFPKPTQTIEPFYFGHPVRKKTHLWMRGLPLLEPTNIVDPTENCHEAGTWFMVGGKERQRNRSKTFPGIAQSFAKQWGDYLLNIEREENTDGPDL